MHLKGSRIKFYQEEDLKKLEVAQDDINTAPLEFKWPNWVSRAVEINDETLILNSNGDAQHKGYIHNGSDIHNKKIHIWIQAKRVSTGANVFTFCHFFANLKTHRGTPMDVNQFTPDVKDNWRDIINGNMSFEPWIAIGDYKD